MFNNSSRKWTFDFKDKEKMESIGSSNNPSTYTSNSDSRQPHTGPRLPSISLPKGGGSIRGIGEKFNVNPATGTSSLSIPVYTSPGRAGFGPDLSISYNSGSGNGPFGFGWSLSLASITRRTEKKLPQYFDSEDWDDKRFENDVFILSGAEDLVRVLSVDDKNKEWNYESLPNRKVKVKTRNENGVMEESDQEYQIIRYRPRIEGLFARIERWINVQTGESHWRTISKDNITTLYGRTSNSRIADPNDPLHRIFSWLICESYDDKGNLVTYEYKSENSQGVEDLSFICEQNRSSISRSANRYIKRIKYGNRLPYKFDSEYLIDEDQILNNDWMFEVVFDYGEHYFEDDLSPQPIVVFIDDNNKNNNNNRPWQTRPDPFSSYRAGFEIRTYRLCQRVLLFHHFVTELGLKDYLVRSTDFIYEKSPVASFLAKVNQSGYVFKDGKYIKKSIPPVEFGYSQPTVQEDIQTILLDFENNPSFVIDKVTDIDSDSLKNLPTGIDGKIYQWVDLDGEGIAGIISEQAGVWFYKHNISALPLNGQDGKPISRARFEPITISSPIPLFSKLNNNDAGGPQHQLMDVDGDGNVDLVRLDRFTSGYFKRSIDKDNQWEPFTPFLYIPNISWHDPNVKFIDLTGDGHADILISEDQAFTWYPSLAEKGFGHYANKIYQQLDEEKGPRVIFADIEQSIYLADMSGDGLVDIVRIRNGEVCYWPNLGYGNFGSKITFDNSPYFDNAFDVFDQKRIRLADIDGSGTTDIIYLDKDGIHIFFNESGNSFSHSVNPNAQFPHIDQLSSVLTVDLFGNGTSCLIWSSPLPADMQKTMYYIDFMGGQKPHLLTSVINNMGAETKIDYSPSTKFYLLDKQMGKPWATKLPFPVSVVERVEVRDKISQNLFVTRYAYHHGYFDGIEREFRGFGMVEQFDTAEFAIFDNGSSPTPLSSTSSTTTTTFSPPSNIESFSHVPPVLTKTWFHTGVYIPGEYVSLQFSKEYFGAPKKEGPDYNNKFKAFVDTLLDDTILPNKIDDTVVNKNLGFVSFFGGDGEEFEACRALKGSILRQEIYALDNLPDGKSECPYSVSERNYTINRLQPKVKGNHYGVFFVHPRETINYQYERNIDDPRISHQLTLQVDRFGNVLESANVAYGRRNKDDQLDPEYQDKQSQLLITCTENEFTNTVPLNVDEQTSNVDAYRTPLQCKGITYDLTGLNLELGDERFSFETIKMAVDGAEQIDYENIPLLSKLQKRIIEDVRTLYRKNDLSGSLPFGQIESMCLQFETYKLALTPGLVKKVYDDRIVDIMLEEKCKYVHFKSGLTEDANWWIPSGHVFYSLNENDDSSAELIFAKDHFFMPCRFRDPFSENISVSDKKDYKIIYDLHNLLIQESIDPLENKVTVITKDGQGQTINAIDYRLLQPWMVTDQNDNRSAVAFDILGMVVGTAIMGKTQELAGDLLNYLDPLLPDYFEPNLDSMTISNHIENPFTSNPFDILKNATTRIVYDFDRYYNNSGSSTTSAVPNVVYTIVRETHVSDLQSGTQTNLQHRFSYFDGFGREIQKKVQAEPGIVESDDRVIDHRWIGSGWMIFNNKGKPVRKYEPFFSDTHQFEFAKVVGVSPTVFYDPLDRAVSTLYPNHTYDKAVFDAWKQEKWDVNDTLTQTDPKTDGDVKGFFERLPDNEYLPTWFEDRINGLLGPIEKDAAQKASKHAGTFSTSYMDSLGRQFLAVEDNGSDGKYKTFIEYDIEGNQREIVDAKGRQVMIYEYDMLGKKIKQNSMDAGSRWILNDITGNPVYNWDSKQNLVYTVYDVLHRPNNLFLLQGVETLHGDDIVRLADLGPLFQQIIYGESIGPVQSKLINARGKIIKSYDQAGIINNVLYDFKGNILETTRQLAADYKNILNWSAASPIQATLEEQIYQTFYTFDALNRPVTVQIAPDNTITHYLYNEAGLPYQINVNLQGEEKTTTFVRNIDYDAKGQRTSIEYGSGLVMENNNVIKNGVTTTYDYDKRTFRLIHLNTKRGTEVMQDLYYTFDPVGNITHIEDKSDLSAGVFTHNCDVRPTTDYTYDANYRLKVADGRELDINGRTAISPTDYTDSRSGQTFPTDCTKMLEYEETFEYDEVGNILQIIHKRRGDPSNPGWSRKYNYNEPSLIFPINQKNNQLSNTVVNDVTDLYSYDTHGNIITMPHLPLMLWDFKDQLASSSSQKRSPNKIPITTYYVYDSFGQRVRKVTEGEAEQGRTPRKQKERIYLNNIFEIYREYNGINGASVKLERQTFHVMDDKKRIALVNTRTQGIDDSAFQTIRYQFDNHLGSSCLELDENSQIITYEEYYPYGGTSYQGRINVIEIERKRYRYISKERDEENGFYYYGARYYMPWLERWVSCDPNGLVDGTLLYGYCRNNPIKYTDFLGTQSIAAPAPKYTPPLPPPPSPDLVVKDNDVIMTWGTSELKKQSVPKDDVSGGTTNQSSWPDAVSNNGDGKEVGYFSAGVAYGWGQYSLGLLGSAFKMPWEMTGIHHKPEDEQLFAQGAAWGIMLASTRDIAESLSLATESGILEGKGKSLWHGQFQGINLIPNAGSAVLQTEADMIMAQALVLEARGIAGSATAIAIQQKYGKGKSIETNEPEPSDYRGRFNYDRIRQGKKPLPSEYDAHHRIPQEYRDHPEFKNFDFDAPSNIRGVKGSRANVNYHQEITNWWNQFREKFPNAQRSQIEDFARSIDKIYGKYYFK